MKAKTKPDADDRTLTLQIHGTEHRLTLAPGAEGFGFRWGTMFQGEPPQWCWGHFVCLLPCKALAGQELLRALAAGHAAWVLECTRLERAMPPSEPTESLDGLGITWSPEHQAVLEATDDATMQELVWLDALRDAARGEGRK